MTLYTGDLVTHAPTQGQLSQAFVEDVEDAVLQMFKAYIGGPIFIALGNRDSSPENNDAPHAVDDNGPLGQQFSWNYEHVSRLWEWYGWINSSTQAEAALHYGAYAVTHPLGVRIITLNGDLYYKPNYFAFLHTDDPDYSGMFTFLIDELQKAEDAGQRAYIVSHVLTGWDGTNPMPNGAEYFYQIVDRYSPHVIAGVFNATFWNKVTEAMERDRALVELQNRYQGKSSVLSPNCTNQACQDARVCYMRSGSVGLGRQCPQGFGSVQSPFTGKNY